jgi:DNA modification methylase
MVELNKIYLDDYLNITKLIENNSIDLVVTDPPYEFISKNPVGGGFMNKENKTHLIELNKEFGMSFNPTILLKEIQRITKIFNAYIFTNKNLLFEYIKFANDNNYNWDILIWSKSNPTPCNNGHYLIDKEYCIFIRKSGAYFNSKLGYEKYFTVKNYPIGKKETTHPTEKPLFFIEDCINISSKENDIVFDGFSGSGTTAIACMNTKRNFICVEKNQKYYDLSMSRVDAIISQYNLF